MTTHTEIIIKLEACKDGAHHPVEVHNRRRRHDDYYIVWGNGCWTLARESLINFISPTIKIDEINGRPCMKMGYYDRPYMFNFK
jgi:hypothetical protein